MNNTPHPAKYSTELLPVLAKYCYGDIIDIMGGTGKAGLLKQFNEKIKTVTINELESEWAIQAKQNGVDTIITGDARTVTGRFNVIVTSPPYGNRLADNFKPSQHDSKRRMYAGDLGRAPSNGSTCCSHFGRGYESQMIDIISRAIKNIIHDRIVWNTSNFIRDFKEVDIFSFYKRVFESLGYKIVARERVSTKRHRGVGANTHLRVEYEDIVAWEREGY